MKKLYLLTTCFILGQFCARGQTGRPQTDLAAEKTAPAAQTDAYSLSGKVTDSASNKPVAGASVFLNSTSRGAVSREDGTFILKGIPGGKFELVVSAIGYATSVKEINGAHLPSSMYIVLHQSATELTALTVEPYLEDGWAQYGKFFLDNFIGTMDNSKFCTIQNRKVLKFHFYKKSNRLSVTADEPLMITNGALGYVVQYKLEQFTCDFNTNILIYAGYPFFQEVSTKRQSRRQKWEEYRQTAYAGSVMHFMRDLYQGNCQQDGFIIRQATKVPNAEKARVKQLYNPAFEKADNFPADTIRHFWQVLKQPDFLTRAVQVSGDSLVTVYADQTKSIFFDGTLEVIWGQPKKGIGYRESGMHLVTPAMVIIGENGSYYPPQEILMSGFWGHSEKIENLLPLDYGQH